jgi:DNA-binding transcriptional regulator YiaG
VAMNRDIVSHMKEKNSAPEIKILRGILGISQSEFAGLIGVSVDSVRKWEQGLNFHPTKRTEAKIQKLVDKVKAAKESGVTRYAPLKL